ncbi:MAG: hypothetical protein KDA21_14325, partial [Phycisphaerales bacterium]|nr:hypothetical protein [Phycisphaerales bacterium]
MRLKPLWVASTLALVGLLPTSPALAQSGPPTYEGTLCYSGGTTTFTVTADPVATAILIYPNPPGGGYFMTNDGAGNYSWSTGALSAGSQVTFHVVIQIPGQYEFADHVMTVNAGCQDFDSTTTGGGGGDPGGGGGDPGGGGGDPGGQTPTSTRGFVQDVIDNGTSSPTITFRAGAPASPIPAVVSVDVNYRLNGGEFQTATMTSGGNFTWNFNVPGAASGDHLSYFFTELVGQEYVDTAWFERTVGEAAPAEPDWPLITIGAGRFRDRHPNEWRFDHWVSGYDAGRSYDFVITDHGNAIDIELYTSPDFPIPATDLKWFAQSGPQPFCDRSITAFGVRMNTPAPDYHTWTITNLNPGQRVDFEFTLLGGQTYYSEFFYYYVGDPRLQQETQHPRAYAAGDASFSTVTVKQFAYNQHTYNLAPEHLVDFISGKIVFETSYATGDLFNPPTAFDCNGGPVYFNMGQSSAFQAGLLGPHYSNDSCISCHMLDGRGDVTDIHDYIFRLSVPGTDPTGAPLAHPVYGEQLDTRATPPLSAEADVAITWENVPGTFDDGTPYTLRRPIVNISNPANGPLGPDAIVSA